MSFNYFAKYFSCISHLKLWQHDALQVCIPPIICEMHLWIECGMFSIACHSNILINRPVKLYNSYIFMKYAHVCSPLIHKWWLIKALLSVLQVKSSSLECCFSRQQSDENTKREGILCFILYHFSGAIQLLHHFLFSSLTLNIFKTLKCVAFNARTKTCPSSFLIQCFPWSVCTTYQKPVPADLFVVCKDTFWDSMSFLKY